MRSDGRFRPWLLLESIRQSHPELSEHVAGWELHELLIVRHNELMGQQIDALDQALAGLPNQQVVSAMAQRLEWLKGDFAVAPVAISHPTLRQEDKSVALFPSSKTVLIGPGFEWTSEGLPLKTVSEIDQIGGCGGGT